MIFDTKIYSSISESIESRDSDFFRFKILSGKEALFFEC